MIERLARLGYLSIAVVYAIVGGLAIGGAVPDHDDAFKVIREQPFGRTMLAAIAIGLAGYAIWRIASGITNSEHREDNAKGMASRLGSIGRGLIHAAISYEVIGLITRRGHGEGSDQAAKHWTARLFDMPFGRFLVVAAALGVIGYGLYQLYAGAKGKLSKQLGGLRPAAKTISRFGIAARGVVFLVIGGSIALAAARYDSSKVRGFSGALRQLRGPGDGWLLVLIGAGLIAYGVYALINARYRRIAAT
jgi:Domain of Unknown Function (DUF1206)